MGRLKMMPSRVKVLPPKVKYEDNAIRKKRNSASIEITKPWRKWYYTKAWKELRLRTLTRDGFVCQKTGAMLSGRHPEPNSPVVDHIVPHRGDADLFWDENNLQSVTKQWHDSVKSVIERAGDKVAAIHPKWLKPSEVGLTIVCGPLASGKSTYVNERANKGDLVIDLDVIASDISGQTLHGWDRDQWLNVALYRRNEMLAYLAKPVGFDRAWFIVSEPKAKHRSWWARTLQSREIVVMETPRQTCIERAEQDADRNHRHTHDLVHKWWNDYHPRPSERRIIPDQQGGVG